MDRLNCKRPRQPSPSPSPSPDVNCQQSSPLENANGKKQHLLGGQETPGTETRYDLDLSFGVFDFPWLKDSLISKSEGWKFEDVFFTSFNGTSTAATLTTGTAFTELSGQGQLLWCSTGSLPDPQEEKYEAHARPPLEGGGPGAEGMDCVWSSLLNQPLQQGSSAL